MIFSALVAATCAAPAADSPPAYGAPAPYAPHPVAKLPPQPFAYQYGVKDDYSAQSDGYATSGSYNVALPDGRIQTVTYRVDGDSGYIADVQYSGEAKYAPYKPAPAPAYKPAPVYHAAPAPYHG